MAANHALIELLDGAAIIGGVDQHGQGVARGIAAVGGALDENGVEGVEEEVANRLRDEQAEDACAT